MTFHDIIDFRKTPSYTHWKLRSPGYDDHMLVAGNLVYVMDKRIVKLHNYNTIIPHWLEDDIVQKVTGEVTLASLPHMSATDGIYDIWLRDVSNLKSVSIRVDGVGLVYQHTLTDNEAQYDCFQVPLAFQTNGERVQKYMFDASQEPFRISWIPTVPLRLHDIRIVLNEEASATLYLSTVYFPRLNRDYLMLHDSEFYINGTPIYSSYKMCYTPSYQTRSWWEWLLPTNKTVKMKSD